MTAVRGDHLGEVCLALLVIFNQGRDLVGCPAVEEWPCDVTILSPWRSAVPQNGGGENAILACTEGLFVFPVCQIASENS